MLTILQGDALEKLRELPAESVHCSVTSPPYWGLRDYSTEGQLGLEKTPEEYVARMVEVFREVRRVLRKDGTCWINLGDTYNANTGAGFNGNAKRPKCARETQMIQPSGLPAKNLIGIPWRVAFALQADGWYLRQDIIWAKPNPMPESVTDRCTKSHEYLFLLTKSASYFYDAEAIKERGLIPEGTLAAKGSEERFGMNGVNARPPEYKLYDGVRNKRSVWTVATSPYPEAHFATYPPDLIKPCIMAGTSAKGCCAKCGAPWERIVERQKPPDSAFNVARFVEDENVKMSPLHRSGKASGQKMQNWLDAHPPQTLGWQPTCECRSKAVTWDSEPAHYTVEPCTMLDPFAGSGTTGAVALELGRKAILIELNPAYIQLIRDRCNITPGLALA